jgi:phosphoglycolate phosphatase-like HAD superfamily hydrolase
MTCSLLKLPQLDSAKFRDGSRRCYEDITILSQLDQNHGIVSNNRHSTIEFVLDFFGLRSSFDTYYGREKTIESLRLKKPNTHYPGQALNNLNADSALYVGDSESDFVAAEGAGINSIFARRPHCCDEELTAVPTLEADNLYEVAALLK